MTEPKKDGRGGPRPGAGRPRNADGKIHRRGVTVAVCLPPALVDLVRASAARNGQSVSAWVRDALEERLERSEVRYGAP